LHYLVFTALFSAVLLLFLLSSFVVYALCTEYHAKLSQKKRLETDENYRLNKQIRAKLSQKKRLEADNKYKPTSQQLGIVAKTLN